MEMHIVARQSGETSAVIGETYSNDWTDSKGFTKESLRDGHLAFTTGATSEDVEINLDRAKLTKIDDVVTYDPITDHTSKGTITYAYSLKKESMEFGELSSPKHSTGNHFP